jgi:hypothetical protein
MMNNGTVKDPAEAERKQALVLSRLLVDHAGRR